MQIASHSKYKNEWKVRTLFLCKGIISALMQLKQMLVIQEQDFLWLNKHFKCLFEGILKYDAVLWDPLDVRCELEGSDLYFIVVSYQSLQADSYLAHRPIHSFQLAGLGEALTSEEHPDPAQLSSRCYIHHCHWITPTPCRLAQGYKVTINV